MEEESFTLTVERVIVVMPGWGVGVVVTFECDEETDEPEGIADVELLVCRISRGVVRYIGGAPCVPPVDDESRLWFPIERFRLLSDLDVDDCHDLRHRWFPTEEAAREHVSATLERWRLPAPWERFVIQ